MVTKADCSEISRKSCQKQIEPSIAHFIQQEHFEYARDMGAIVELSPLHLTSHKSNRFTMSISFLANIALFAAPLLVPYFNKAR